LGIDSLLKDAWNVLGLLALTNVVDFAARADGPPGDRSN